MISLYHYSLDQPSQVIDHFLTFLSEDEIQKAHRFVFKKDQYASIISRGLVRCLVAEQLECHPSAVVFQYTPAGKPFVASCFQQPQVYFNVSHSADVVIIGLCLDREMGVDIELCRDHSDRMDLAEHYFHPQEVENLRLLPREAQNEMFYAYWTRKEAYLKATGEGIGGSDLRELNVSRSPTYFDCDYPGFPYWKVISYSVMERYATALAFPVKSFDDSIVVSCQIPPLFTASTVVKI